MRPQTIKKIAKWGIGIILTPMLLFVMLAILVYLPPVQNWLVKQVASYASDKTGMQISVNHVSLKFPLDLSVEGFRMIQPNDSLPQVRDTVADVDRLVVDVKLMPLFKQTVVIDELEFNHMKLNTTDFVHEARVKGIVGRLAVKSRGINWEKQTVNIDNALLSDAKVNVELSDTVPPDTTESKNYWQISVSQLNVSRTGVTVHMPGDTLQVAAYMGEATAKKGFFDLDKGLYQLQTLDLKDGSVQYDNNFEPRIKGLDANHISLTDVLIGIDSLRYCAPKLDLRLRACSFKEKSGINVSSFTSGISLDSTKVMLPDLRLTTPDSYLKAHLAMELNAFDDKNPGVLHLSADGAFGKQDIMRFLGGMPTSFIRRWPNQPLTVKAVLSGNLKRLDFTGLNVNLPTAFNVHARGFAANVSDMDNLQATVNLEANTYNLDFVTALDGTNDLHVPHGINLRGNVKADGKRYSLDLTAHEGRGRVKAKGAVNMSSMAYNAAISIEDLNLSHYMPKSGMGVFTGDMTVDGHGTNFLSARTKLTARAGIKRFTYDRYNLDGISFKADVADGKAFADINSTNPLLQGNISLEALLNPKRVNTVVTADLKHADWYGLKMVKAPLTTSLTCHVALDTDLKNMISVDGSVRDIMVVDSGKVYTPDDLTVNVYSSRDTTHIVGHCGDFRLLLNGRFGYKRILDQCNHFTAELANELKEKKLNLITLRHKLPLAQLYLTTGKENPLSRFIARAGYTFSEASIDLTSSPYDGLNGDVEIFTLKNSQVQLDTVHVSIASDSTHCTYEAQVRNAKNNPQYVFNAYLDGYLFEKGSGLNVRFYDAKDELGLKLGMEASMETDGIKIHMLTDNPIIGYKKFGVNEDNYLYLRSDRRISADLRLRADDDMAVQIYTNDENTEALQDLTVGLHKFDLEKVLSVIPYMPAVTGMMNGDFHVIQTPEELSVSSTLSVDSMTYERVRMGDISTEFVYMPKSDGTHSVNGTLACNGDEVADISGTYKSEGEGYLDAQVDFNRTPLRLVNGFMPDRIISLRGYADGSLSVKGPLMAPDANGQVVLDSCRIWSAQYGVRLRAGDVPLRIVGSNLLFEKFNLVANNDNQLTLDGNIDFSHLDAMQMDLRMAAKNFQIIDSKERRRSIAYGKAFVDFFARINGAVDNLNMRGNLNVLGTTDMSYILRDSPLSTNNQLDELVKFTSFSDTTTTVVEHQQLSGFSMDMMVNVDQGAHIMCYLNETHSNYVDLMGGGSLRMKYNSVDDLRLTGKYTLDSGEMKYSLPVIPLKTFTIQDGSYIEFTGDPMNPKLNITATERTKATVSSDDNESGRTVEFDCGVVITKTLLDMGLEFTLDAPEDMTLHNELLSMSKEQRGKLAVTMLTTGMYLADGNTSGFSMNSALSSFLQSEINNITGNALRTLDLSFGMDNSTDAGGNTHTDYSFKFAKRFWNNRMRIVVGGKVSTGADVANQNESFFDNVTLEYRLGNSSDKYVKLYYDNNAYDWLEGTTREYGVGLIWRRSLQNLNDLFRSNRPKSGVIAVPDSINNKKQ